MRRYTKLLSVIMSAMMIVSSVPFSAIAEEDVYETSVADIIEEETGESPGGLSEVLTEESAEESEEASVEEENVETESSEVHEDPVEEESSQPEEGTTPSEESSETSEEVSDTIDGESSEESGEVSTEESSEESGEVPAEESYEESGETSDTESSEEENLEAEEETEAEEGKNSEDITDIPEGLNYYKADETEVIISSYEGDEPELIIPATIEGLPVTAIDEWAFDENEVITSVTLPESVTSIGDYAFFACINLEYINTQAVTDIGEKAFWGCKKLADVNGLVIVNNVVYDFAFGEKEGLLDVVIPDSVTEIVEEAFNSVQNIRSVTTSAGNIGASAFKDCMKLTTLTLKEGVETIGVGAFYNCNLAAVHIPSSVRTIGDSAFSLNKNLKSLTFDYGIDTIGSSAFSNCQHIEKIVFPSSLTTIGDYAFSICSYLKEITVPSSITFVGEGAFLGCSQTVTAHISCMSTLSESDIGDNIKADIVHLGEIETAFTWDGVSTCTIEIHCKECNVTESKNCDITSAVTKKATTETVGTTTYTASYTVGDKSYTDSKSLDNIPVMEYTAPTAKTLTYTGSAQTLVNAGKTNGGTLQYSTDGKTYTTGLPKKTSVGIYKVYYKVVGNESYNSVSAKYITVKIVPQKAVISSCANISTGIKLTWGKVTGATGYEVYRGSSKIATVTS
ncbi:MAG: leucine-rich repeat domain-containing protein, partial [Clostridia bacterium]|nr:leucine-rich repeat domain-containing protein [Clostridia bacterium]